MKHDLNRNLQWRAKRLYALFACLVLTLPFAVVPAFAADDPLSVVTSLSDFIFSLIRAVGLILPPFDKADILKGVVLGGVLPRKTFSMGHAEEKRYYVECRKITE